MGIPGVSEDKESTCNVGDLGLVLGLGRSPGGGHGNSLQYFCLENPQGQRSLAGSCPWGCKELNMTEQLSTVQWSFEERLCAVCDPGKSVGIFETQLPFI